MSEIVIELKSLFNSDDFKEDIITRVLEKYKDKTVEKRIKISRKFRLYYKNRKY